MLPNKFLRHSLRRLHLTNKTSFNYVSHQYKPTSGNSLPPKSDKLPLKGFSVLVLAGATIYLARERQLQQAKLKKEEELKIRSKALQTRFNKYANHQDVNGRKNLYTCDLFRAILNVSREELSNEKIAKLCPEIFNLFKNDDIFSVTDYILLTSILISPKTQFKIAFKMLDTDNNDFVTPVEFKALKDMFWAKMMAIPDCQEGTVTSLSIKFFGPPENQNKTLTLQQFEAFSKSFQEAVFKLEYEILAEKSPSTHGVSRADFADMILDLSKLAEETKTKRIGKLIDPARSVTFDDYKAYRVLLNNLNKFKEIMKFYALADRPVRLGEMDRATKLATLEEEDISGDIVELLFSIYDDTPEDGVMDYKDFLTAFKDDCRYRYVY